MSAAVPMAIASAPRAIAFAASALLLMPPAAMMDASFLMPSCLSLSSTAARACSMGMPRWSRMITGAAPVPPLKPSIYTISAPALTIPDAMAATLCTAAIFTETGFV